MMHYLSNLCWRGTIEDYINCPDEEEYSSCPTGPNNTKPQLGNIFYDLDKINQLTFDKKEKINDIISAYNDFVKLGKEYIFTPDKLRKHRYGTSINKLYRLLHETFGFDYKLLKEQFPRQ